MDRRFLTVLGVSLVFALVVSSIFYQMVGKAGSSQQPQVKTDVKDLVVAAKTINVGVTVKPEDLKLTKVATEAFPKGAFSKVEDVISRPAISSILQDETIIEGRLGLRNAGTMISPMIPPGMRAVTIRVNEVVGVAGFVMPGMKVDVLVTGRPPNGDEVVTTTVLQNMLVLSAGQTMQPDARGQPINASTVTLLTTPEQAETLTLAGNEGRIQLILRNGNDNGETKPPGRQVRSLYGNYTKPAESKKTVASDEGAPRPRRVRPVPVAKADAVPAQVAPPPPLPPPPPSEIIEFRGTVKSVGQVSQRTN